MPHSKRSQEGYLVIDHRAAGGMPPDVAQQGGAIPVRSGAMFESATITCSHCQRIVVLNPDRQRSRGYCPKCDHYICDNCEAARVASGGECRPFSKIIDETLERAVRSTI